MTNKRSILTIVLVEMLIDDIVRNKTEYDIEIMNIFLAIEFLRIVPSIKEEIKYSKVFLDVDNK